MPQETQFTKSLALVEMTDSNVQNTQEMASVWGDVRQEFEQIGASIDDSYAALGEFDFLVTFEGPTTETAFKADVILERHGLNVRTTQIIDTDAFSELVTDV